MPIKVTCSNCGGVLHAPDDAGGKRGRCPTCGNILPIPAAAGGGLPTPPAATGAAGPSRASQSFGEFSLGDKAGAASPRSAEPAPRPVTEPRRASVAIPAAKDDARPEKRKPTSPFAKPGSGSGMPEADTTDGQIRAWQKARGGLWWVRSAAWLFLIPVLALNGLRLYEHFVKPLNFGGLLGLDWLPPQAELDLLLFGVPVLLGLLFLVFGRLGVSGVPRKTGARGLGLFSALASLTVLCAVVAVMFPQIAAVLSGEPAAVTVQGEWQLFPLKGGDKLLEDGNKLALIQRFGLMIAVAAFLVAEFWFVSSLGRMASSLGNQRFGGRVTRFMLLMGISAGFLLATGMVRPASSEAELPREPGPRVAIKDNPEPLKMAMPAGKKQPDDVFKEPKEKGKGAGQPKKGKDGGGAGGGMPQPPAIPVGGEPPPSAPVAPAGTPGFDFNASVKRTAGEVHGIVRKESLSLMNSLEASIAPDFGHWPAVRTGTFLLAGLLVGMMYLRMVGAGRRAIREWLDQHQPSE